MKALSFAAQVIAGLICMAAAVLAYVGSMS